MTIETVAELKALLESLTRNELDGITSKMSLEASEWQDSPPYFRDETKAANVKRLVLWAVRAASPARARLINLATAIARERRQAPVRGPVPNTRYLAWADFVALPHYPLIERAVHYPHDYRLKAAPATPDGYVSVAAIYNMAEWANWKSSSLGARDKAIADAIDALRLGDLMRLNAGRRSDQPALFPIAMLR